MKVFQHRLVLVTSIAAIAVGAFFVGRLLDRDRAPNVILITVDTLRADHLGAYGYRRATSPNFDAFARESILYRRAFSHAPETNPSLGSLMTSFYPHETKVERNQQQLQPGVTTLAELLKAHGWRTAAVVSNTSLQRGSGFEQGFDDYDDRMEGRATAVGILREKPAPQTTAAAEGWLRQHHGERFFLWVHYMDPHAPYLPPQPYDTMFRGDGTAGGRRLPFISKEEFLSGVMSGGIPPNARIDDRAEADFYITQYDGEIRYFDHWFGEFLNVIRNLHLFDNTILIVTADHGEGMGEQDYFFNHVKFVYSGLIHVPLLIRLPGQSSQGQQVSMPVALVDITPTVLKLLSINTTTPLRGMPMLQPQPRTIWAQSSAGGNATVISEGFKFFSDQKESHLYDVEKDFYETHDVLIDGSVEMLEHAARLKNELSRILNEDRLGLGPPMVWVVQAETKDALKTLGYVQ